MLRNIPTDVPLEELWKHTPYITALGTVDPHGGNDPEYLRDRCRQIVRRALEQAVEDAAKKLAHDVSVEIITSGPNLSAVATLHVSAGVPEALGRWLAAMLHTGVIKQPLYFGEEDDG